MSFLVRRLVRLAVVTVALVVSTFLMIQLTPGDPARTIAGLSANQSTIGSIREEFHLDRPVPSQFWHYVAGLAHGDLGVSYASRQPVRQVLTDRVGPTVELAFASITLILVFGIGLGLIGAVLSRRGGRLFETFFSAGTGAMTAIPHYLLATFLVFAFAVTWRLFPVAGDASFSAIILPSVAISVGPAAVIARILRVRTLEVLEEPYIRAAQSKRLSPGTFYGRHVFPNAMTTVAAMGGVLFAGLIGGAVIVEQVFARPGLGTALVHAVLIGDYPVVQGITLVIGVSVVIVNSLVDVLLGLLDPRTMEREL